MNRGTALKLKQLLIIVVVWLIMGFFIAVYDHLVLLINNVATLSEEYSFTFSVIRNMGAGLIGGLLGGSALVFYVNVKYRDKPYAYTIFAVLIPFILIVALITVIMGLILIPLRTGTGLSDPAFPAAFSDFVKNKGPLKSAFAWSFIVAVTQLMLQVNSKFGHDTFWDILRGKYNTPKEEKRIFMFLDINSSTSIAERLGDEKYHALLKDFFADITDPILENKGSIYQYVGDEVIVAWNYKDGIESTQCLRCFFDMKLQILKMQEKYASRYGILPSFKAGIHCGRVIAGEVGIIKRDITYSGDVLNTTSRILNKCSEFKVEVIVSSDLLSELYRLKEYVTQPLGAIKLRGKEKEVLLNALMPL